MQDNDQNPINAPMVLGFEGAPVRCVIIEGEPWWVGKDVCAALGIANHNDALSRLVGDERRGVGITAPLGGKQTATAVNEPGLYRLIFSSRVPSAERFKGWLVYEVLPQIRRTGEYRAGGDPDLSAAALKDFPNVPIEAIREVRMMLRETRLTAGKEAARALWDEFGIGEIVSDNAFRAGDDFEAVLLECLGQRFEITGENSDRLSAIDVISTLERPMSKAGAPCSPRRLSRALSQLSQVYRDPSSDARFWRVKASTTFYAGLRVRKSAAH